MSDAAFEFAGVEAVARPDGALWLPAERTLVVADLHLEKASSLARRGALIPPYDSRATLGALRGAIDRHDPRCVLCLGDSFHDGEGPVRLTVQDRRALQDLMNGREWAWIVGNHDPRPAAGLGGAVAEELSLGRLTFRHEAELEAPAGEVSGHFHPKAIVATGARRVRAPCFITDGRRLILPAFGALTGGLDVFDPAIAGLLAPRFTVFVLGRRRVHRVSSAGLLSPR